MDFNTLSKIAWKRHFNTFIKVLADFKILGLLGLMLFILYGIGWDMLLKPNLESLKSRDEAIRQQRDAFNQQNDLQRQYSAWEEQLKNLDVKLTAIPVDSQLKVVSLRISTELASLARGENRPEQLAPLPPPHDERSGIDITPLGNETIDIQALEGTPAPAPAAGSEAGLGGAVATPTTLPVQRYDYELKATGTYAALVDLLNELALKKDLVQINKITIKKPESADDAQPPDPEADPQYPVKLELTVTLSVYLYEDSTLAAE